MAPGIRAASRATWDDCSSFHLALDLRRADRPEATDQGLLQYREATADWRAGVPTQKDFEDARVAKLFESPAGRCLTGQPQTTTGFVRCCREK